MRFSKVLPLVAALLHASSWVAAQEAVSAERAKALLVRFGQYWSQRELEVQYTLRYYEDDTLTSWDEWTIWGTPERWDSKVLRRDGKGRLRNVRIEFGEREYYVSAGRRGWAATITRVQSGNVIEARCPLQKYLFAINGKPWSRAVFDHAPIEAYRLNYELSTLLAVRMPLVPNYVSAIADGGKFSGFLCWEARFRMGETGAMQLTEVLGLGSRMVSDPYGPPGSLVPNALAMSSPEVLPVLGKTAAVVVNSSTFEDFIEVENWTFPTGMRLRGADGELYAQIERASLRMGSVGLSKEIVFEFRPPSEFGEVGGLLDKRNGRVLYFGVWPGSEDTVLKELLKKGDDLARKHEINLPRGLAYLLGGAALGFLVIWLLWPGGGRTRSGAMR